MPNFPLQAGRYVASSFGSWSGLVLSQPDSTHLTVSPQQVATSTGDVFQPWATNAPLLIGAGTANAETATPSVVDLSVAGQVTLTFGSPLAHTHNAGESVASGTYGLQECINNAPAKSVVLADAVWAAAGGTTTMIQNAHGSTNVLIEDTAASGGISYYAWTGSAYATVESPSGVVSIALGGTGQTTAAAGLTALAGGNQSGNKVLASPANGSSGVIAARALVAADIPSLVATYQATAGQNTPGANGYSQLVAAPASAGAAGVAGQEAYDSGFYYRCVATNTWLRVAIATW